MLTLECNYSKKIGLPNYSSHQFMVTLRTEITDVSTVQAESDRLYGLLQNAVDTSLQKVGDLPQAAPQNGNGNGNGGGHTNGNNDAWQCSPKQRELILKITDEHKLDKVVVDQLAIDRFGKGVRQLNKLEASGLIDELLEQTGQKNGNRRFNRPTPARATRSRCSNHRSLRQKNHSRKIGLKNFRKLSQLHGWACGIRAG